MRSLGPGPARPVIRGLDGDRVLVLQDGQRMGDLSSQSGDHGVPVNPASAQRIEVVRGPATLLYGANAIGGLVNVVTDQIPTEKVTAPDRHRSPSTSAATTCRPARPATCTSATAASPCTSAAAASAPTATRRRDGEVDNSQSRSGFVNVGGGWTGDRQYAGVSYGYDDTKYGVPVLEDGRDQPHAEAPCLLGPRRRPGARPALLRSYRATLGVRRYTHDGARGRRDRHPVREQHRRRRGAGVAPPGGPVVGLGRRLVPRPRSSRRKGPKRCRRRSTSGRSRRSSTKRSTWPHFTLQFGGRVDHTHVRTGRACCPTVTSPSSRARSARCIRPQAASDNLVVALSLARAARNPALEELYFFGPHPGNLTFEIGNPDLKSEHALGFDVSVRGPLDLASAGVP